MQGNREYTPQQVVDQLGLGTKMPARKGPGQPMVPPQQMQGSRFISPISECEFTVNAVLEELQRDAWPSQPALRPSRCTGTAIKVVRLLSTPFNAEIVSSDVLGVLSHAVAFQSCRS